MLFAKKKNLKFEEMEHIESPNLSELEATLDFLKKTPEKKDDEETGTVLNPMPAIEPPKLDAEKRTPGSDEADDVTPSPAAQDIAFEDENAADHSNESNNGASVSDKNETVVSEEIIKKAEALKEKQLLNDTVNNEAELALKKDEANITKTSDDVNNEPPKEISDAVKEAMALQAEYEAKKKDMPEEELRRKSRFMRNRAYPVKNAAGAAAEQGETGADKKESNQNDADGENGVTDKESNNSDEKELKSDAAATENENAAQSPDEIKKAVNNENNEKVESSAETEGTRESVKADETANENTNEENKNEPAAKVTETVTATEKKPTPIRKGASTSITSNLKLPNDVIVSNIESSARSMGKYVGAAKIANPLPHPKKHITRNMDFDYPVSAAQMHFDLEDLNGMDFFDIDD
ncbi:MAG: hypothetical protein J6N47_03405 [Lachnospiraceae bacterium]|nr:hypothetical protein [Lachnospiraceae bacterium]